MKEMIFAVNNKSGGVFMNDNLNLLRECSAGIKTAVTSIDEILPYVRDEKLREILTGSKDAHEILAAAVDGQLRSIGSNDKEPNPMAKTMSWMKINAELSVNPTSAQAASLITDGCDMGVKSLHKYLNKYEGADESTRSLARSISELEETLEKDMRPYL